MLLHHMKDGECQKVPYYEKWVDSVPNLVWFICLKVYQLLTDYLRPELDLFVNVWLQSQPSFQCSIEFLFNYTFIWLQSFVYKRLYLFQVFLSNTNNLFTLVEFQVFLSNIE